MCKDNHYDFFVGIDISKKVLDISLITSQNKTLLYEQIDNNPEAIKRFMNKIKLKGIVLKECLFCAEFTGIYSNYVQQVLAKYSLNLWMENPMQIKRTQGMVRGKSDKVDSLRIAQYARKHCDNVKLWMPDRTQVQMLKKLTSLRNRLLNTKKRLQQTFKEQEFLTRKEIEMLKDSCSESLNAIKNDIRQTENKIKEIINNDKELSNLYSIATSVDGIGMHTAVEVIVTTNEFKNISEGKKYACYSGVVPFNYSSGSSVNKRPRISSMANKGVKTLLHMSALSVINMDGELRDYFLRKVGEGKNKMSVLNAIRNKLILRIFACVKNNRPYQKKLNNSLA